MFLLCLEFQFIKGWVNLFLFSLMKIVFDLFSFLIQVVTELQEKRKNGVFNYVTCNKVWLDKACGTKELCTWGQTAGEIWAPRVLYCPHVPISVTIPVIIIY